MKQVLQALGSKKRIPWNAGKGAGWTDKRGYRWVYVTRNGKRTAMREHRLVMEQHMGRPLEPWELVHHKDQNPGNNNIDNLELTTWPDHTQSHHTGSRRDMALRDAATAFAQMREELKRERGIKSDLLAACKEAKMLAAHGIGAVTLGEDAWSRANSDRNIGEIKRITAIIDAAIAKAGGAA